MTNRTKEVQDLKSFLTDDAPAQPAAVSAHKPKAEQGPLVRINFIVSGEERMALKKAAIDEGKTVSGLIRESLAAAGYFASTKEGE